MNEEKSHVGLGHEVCPVCGTKHNESVLLDKRLRNTLTRDMVTGLSLCKKCESLSGEYVALVGVSNKGSSSTLKQEDAIRTGEIVHVRRSAASKIFNVSFDQNQPMVFVESEVIDHLKKLEAQH